jgi:hypothetical protein
MNSEIIFVVEENMEGGYTAGALGHSIFCEADTWDELKVAVQDAVRVHFENNELGVDRDTLIESLFG